MFLEWLSTKIAKMVLLHWTKWLPELKQEKPLIGISYSTEAIIFMADFSSDERSRAIMALLSQELYGLEPWNLGHAYIWKSEAQSYHQ